MKISVIGCNSYYGYGPSYERGQVAASFSKLGHTVYFHGVEPGRKVSDRIAGEIAEFQPDLTLFIPHEFEVDPSDIKQAGVPLVLLLADDQWRRAFGIQMADVCDYVMANAYDSMDAYGAKSIPFEWAVFEDVWCGEPVERIYDVSFVAQHYGQRAEIIRALREGGVQVHLRGQGYEGGIAPLDEMAAIMQRSKIGLNLSKASQGNVYALKIRPFETAAAGAMILSEYAPQIEKNFVENVEAVWFASIDEMIEKACYYLTHDDKREAIARAGQARVLRDHTLARRWDVMFKAVGL